MFIDFKWLFTEARCFWVTFRRDLFPRVRRVHEGGVMDLIVDVFIFIEREGSAQTNVHDHTNWPHVQGPIITLVQEDLGGQVSRRTHDRPTERLLSDDASKAKVTKFHLCVRDSEVQVGGSWVEEEEQKKLTIHIKNFLLFYWTIVWMLTLSN